MHIREARVEDTALIHAIGCRSYRHNFTDIWSTEGIEAHLERGFTQSIIRQSISDTSRHLWLLLSPDTEQTPVGFATLVLNSPIPTTKKTGLELQKLYFLPEASGLGCGNYLMGFIVQYARENNYQQLWLDVLKSNVGAIRFYKANGFEPIGELPFKTDLSEVGQWVMVKSL